MLLLPSGLFRCYNRVFSARGAKLERITQAEGEHYISVVSSFFNFLVIHGGQSVECQTAVKQRRPYAALPFSQRRCNKRKQCVPVPNILMDIYLYRK